MAGIKIQDIPLANKAKDTDKIPISNGSGKAQAITIKQLGEVVGVGKKIENGGEIFNDYVNNIALGVNSHSEGSGVKALGDNTHIGGLGEKKYEGNARIEPRLPTIYYLIFDVNNIEEGDVIYFKDTYSVVSKKKKDSPEYVLENNPLVDSEKYSGNIIVYSGVAYGNNSHSHGKNNATIGESSFASGSNNVVNGNNSSAIGNKNKITDSTANDSHIIGSNNICDANGCIILGNNNKALGSSAFIIGALNTVEANTLNNVIENSDNKIKSYSNDAHAEGYMNEIDSYASHSHVEGSHNKVSNPDEHAAGFRNISYKNDDESIATRRTTGGGIKKEVSGGTQYEPRNLEELKVNGDYYLMGVGGFDGTNSNLDTTISVNTILNSVGDISKVLDSINGKIV